MSKTLPDNLPDCTVFLLAKAYQKAHGLIQQRLKPFGLTNLQHLVLEGLWYRPGVTAAELGRLLRLDKATLSGVVERMAEGGWLLKREDPGDRRVVRLFPSERAEALKERLIAERRAANAELLSAYTLEERVVLKRLLRDLL